MGKRIIYNEGDAVGDYGITYIKDMSDYIKPDGRPDRRCLFKCSCGKEFAALLRSVRHNATKSCGCLVMKHISNLNAKDITDCRFGKLVAKYPTGRVNKSGQRYWYCECDCGSNVEKVASELLAGRAKSCGCVSSFGEIRVAEVLKELDINFIKQYSPSDCINPHTGKRLYFDFFVPDYNCCIEYDGQQHYDFFGITNFFHKTFTDYQEAKFRDKYKTRYCHNHGIGLIRIPYRHYDILTPDYLQRRLNAKKANR